MVSHVIVPERNGTRRPVHDGMPLDIEEEVIMKSLNVSQPISSVTARTRFAAAKAMTSTYALSDLGWASKLT